MKLDCSNCGSTLEIEKFLEILKCQYCATLYYPTWISDSFRVDYIGQSSEFNCPLCFTALIKGKIGEFDINACNQCHGLLLSSKTLFPLIRYLRKDRFPMGRKGDKVPLEDFQRIIQCPKCQIDMHVHEYFGPGDYAIDSCMDCGYVWLDSGELNKSITIEWTGTVWN